MVGLTTTTRVLKYGSCYGFVCAEYRILTSVCPTWSMRGLWEWEVFWMLLDAFGCCLYVCCMWVWGVHVWCVVVDLQIWFCVILCRIRCEESACCDLVSCIYVVLSLLMFLSTTLFVLLVVCLMMFVNCLLNAFAICLCVVAVLLLKEIVLLWVWVGFLISSPCMVLHSVCVLFRCSFHMFVLCGVWGK